MSHFSTLVLVKSPVEVESQVHDLLKPYSEEGEWFKKGSKWDWWTIGGRFSAMLDNNYNPCEDPDNFETCSTCNGTGVRPGGREVFGEEWVKEMKGCNGCLGKGKRLKFESDWKEFPGNVIPVSDIKNWKFPPYAVVTPDGEWHEKGQMGWWGVELETKESKGDWLVTVKKLLKENQDCTAVVVDCHV
jgi:hypothetical protein